MIALLSTRRGRWLLALTLAVITIAIFAPALQNDFVNYDDDVNFLQNLNYRGLGWTQIQWMWTSHTVGRYIPVTWMTLGLDYLLFGMEPWGYHLTSILWHTAGAIMFYFLAIALFRKALPNVDCGRIAIGACFAALVFAIHPLRVESVAWVTERRDVVSGFFYLVAILAYVRRWPYWVMFGSFVLAILSKEIAVTLPVVLLILDVYPLRRLLPAVRGVWIEKVPLFVLAAADSALALYFGRQDELTFSLAQSGWLQRLAISIYSLAFYLWKTLVPLHLAPFYPATAHRLDPRALPFQLSAVLLILLMTAAVLFRKRAPAFSAVLAAYGVTLLPVVGIFRNGWQIAADRYSYLSCLGWALLAGAGLLLIWTWTGKAAALTIVTVGGLLGFLTLRQIGVWENSETLWTYSLQTEPSFLAWNNLGAMASAQGDTVNALEDYKRATELNPDYDLSHNNLGIAMLQLEAWEEAARQFQIALQLKPDLVPSQSGLGYALLKQGKREEAIEHFRTALRINPNYQPAREHLAEALR